MSTIRALREVDPSGVLLEAVSDPIREYLRCRKVWLPNIVLCALILLDVHRTAASCSRSCGGVSNCPCHETPRGHRGLRLLSAATQLPGGVPRQDAIRCIVSLLTDGGSAEDGGGADSLFQELTRSANEHEVRVAPSSTLPRRR